MHGNIDTVIGALCQPDLVDAPLDARGSGESRATANAVHRIGTAGGANSVCRWWANFLTLHVTSMILVLVKYLAYVILTTPPKIGERESSAVVQNIGSIQLVG